MSMTTKPRADSQPTPVDLVFHTDEMNEAIDCLHRVSLLLNEVSERPHTWKWVAIALQGAVQGFMVLSLKGTWSANVMHFEDKQRMYAEAADGRAALPEPGDRLEDFWDLYAGIKQEDRMSVNGFMAKPFKPHGSQTESLKTINELRNLFVHYQPMSWSRYVGTWPKATFEVLDIIWSLCFVCTAVTFHGDRISDDPYERRMVDEMRVDRLVRECRDKCLSLSKAYAKALPRFEDKERMKEIEKLRKRIRIKETTLALLD